MGVKTGSLSYVANRGKFYREKDEDVLRSFRNLLNTARHDAFTVGYHARDEEVAAKDAQIRKLAGQRDGETLRADSSESEISALREMVRDLVSAINRGNLPDAIEAASRASALLTDNRMEDGGDIG